MPGGNGALVRHAHPEHIDQLAADFPQLLEVRVTDAQGESLGHVARSLGGTPRVLFDPPGRRIVLPPRASPLSNHDGSGNRVVAWHPIVAGTLLGWVRLERSTQALGALRERIWFGTIVAGLLAAASSAALLGWLLRSSVRSIGRSKDFAVGLARIDGQQIESLEGPVETRELGIALNQASTRLFEQRQAIDAGMATLQLQEAVLADTNEQLSTIFALSPDALLSFDATGRIRFANEAFFRISGLGAHAVGARDSGDGFGELVGIHRSRRIRSRHDEAIDDRIERILVPADQHPARQRRAAPC